VLSFFSVEFVVLAGVVMLSLVIAAAGAAGFLAIVMHLITGAARRPVAAHPWTFPLLALLLVVSPTVWTTLWATTSDPADRSMERFLSKEVGAHSYRATRRLEAENGGRKGWLEATTEYSPADGFRYQITAEGGADTIRSKVLKAVLAGEQDVIALGEAARSALAPSNYMFEPSGLDAEGLANVRLSPRRKERALLAGVMFLRPDEGELVRVQGRLAKNPSFWVTNVDIVRKYERIAGAVVPVVLESNAHVRLIGPATFRMTYTYSEIDGTVVTGSLPLPRS
jgi:hypothetical protein